MSEELFKVIEHDNMTGWDRYLDNMATSPWTGTFTRAQAEVTVEWRQKNIVSRYSYRIARLEPWMTDNEQARTRHGRDHSTAFPLEDCGDIDCREAARRLITAAILKDLRL